MSRFVREIHFVINDGGVEASAGGECNDNDQEKGNIFHSLFLHHVWDGGSILLDGMIMIGMINGIGSLISAQSMTWDWAINVRQNGIIYEIFFSCIIHEMGEDLSMRWYVS